VPLPLLAIAVIGASAYFAKKQSDKNDASQTEHDNERRKNENIIDIESMPFLVATLYVVANIDGTIDEREEAFITIEIDNMLSKLKLHDSKTESRIKNAIKKNTGTKVIYKVV